MLYSVIVGDQSKIRNEWTITTDEYNNTSISCESLRQKLRIGPNVSETLDFDYMHNNTIAYKIASSIFLSNNNKNMNLAIMNYRKKNKKHDNHKDPEILYLSSITDNYSLLSYQLEEGAEILHTYRWKESHQGCVIVFYPNDNTNQGEKQHLIRLSVKDKSSNRFAWIDLWYYYETDENDDIPSAGKKPRIEIKKTIIEDGHVVYKLKHQKPTHFKIQISDNRFLTCTYLVREKDIDVVSELTNDIPNRILLQCPDDFNPEENEKDRELLDTFSSTIKENRIRAFTLVNGLRVPNDFLREHGILYLFSYDTGKNMIKCMKSN